MRFAFTRYGMLSLASCITLGASLSLAGCVTTDPIEFDPDENYPPSGVSQSAAEYPLREIGQLDLDDPVETPELPLQVVVRDPNVEQTLQYRIFLDSPNPPPTEEFPIDQGSIEPSGDVERPRTFNVPYNLLAPGICHKIELVIVGRFFGFVEPRRPVEEGDFDNLTWWIEVTDADNPTIEDECQ